MQEIQKDKPTKKNKGKYNRSAILAKKVFSLVTEEGYSMGKAMREVGYTIAYSKNPQQLTDNKSWQDLCDEILPNKDLLDKNKELLNAKKPVYYEGLPTGDEINDNAAQNKALELAYRIKGSFAPERFTMLDPLDDLTIEQLESELNQLDNQLARYDKATNGQGNFRKTKKGTPKSKGKKITK